MQTYNPNVNAATGSVGEAAVFLGSSIVALIGAVTLQLIGLASGQFAVWSVAALFLVWLSAAAFTLGILEYRRSQEPEKLYHGPEV